MIQSFNKTSICVYICHVKCSHHPHARIMHDIWGSVVWKYPLAAKFMSFICLTVYSDLTVPWGISSSAVWSKKVCRGCAAGDDLGEQCGAEEALTWVENLHSGVGVRMLFMDHLSADLLSKNLPGESEGIQVINIHIALNNNRDTNHTMDTQSYVYVSPSRSIWPNNCRIRFLQEDSHSIYNLN